MHTGRRDPGEDQPRKQGLGFDRPRQFRTKGRGKGDQNSPEPVISASRAQGQKPRRMGLSRAKKLRACMIQGRHGQAKKEGKQANAVQNRGLEHPANTSKRNPRMDHERRQCPGLDHPGLPWRSKARGEGAQHYPDHWIGAFYAQREKRPRIASSREAGPTSGSSSPTVEKQMP